jgi:hypothetical protein
MIFSVACAVHFPGSDLSASQTMKDGKPQHSRYLSRLIRDLSSFARLREALFNLLISFAPKADNDRLGASIRRCCRRGSFSSADAASRSFRPLSCHCTQTLLLFRFHCVAFARRTDVGSKGNIRGATSRDRKKKLHDSAGLYASLYARDPKRRCSDASPNDVKICR